MNENLYSPINSEDDYNKAYQESQDSLNKYWLEISHSYEWKNPPSIGLNGDFSDDVHISWFEDGLLNITENILDRHIKDQPNKVALIFEPNDPNKESITYTYQEMHERVCQICEVLSGQGLEKGDVACFYMSMIPELLFSVLACARMGVTHSVVFGGFSATALKNRIEDCKPKVIITNDSGYRGNKKIAIKKTVDEALSSSSHNSKVLMWKHTNDSEVECSDKDVIINSLIDPSTSHFPPTYVSSEHPLFILYTSGSTGKPKGLVHSTAGYMVWCSETFKHVFQMKDDSDIFWDTADIGWITGHSYFTYAPFINGVTQVMFEGVPTWPEPDRFWKIIEEHKVTHFYTAPTAIRALQAHGDDYVLKPDLSSLKVLGSVGEPINEEAWKWFKEKVGQNNCPLVDTWWQTETGGIMISNLAGVTKEKATAATTPLPGVNPVLLTPEGEEIKTPNTSGHLCVQTPWPGVARTVYGDHERYKNTYFQTHPGYYFTGDAATFDEKGLYRISGRVDDVVNVSGHRISTAELEDVIDLNETVIEAAVVGAPHEVKGTCLYAFIISNDKSADTETLKENINNEITKSLGAFCKLERVIMVDDLPKTRSGKIMRRLLRKISAGETNFGDTSTIVNPEILEKIQKALS